uniref:Uncharacterized protein n=1 Tax=Oryza brachyantha TaxID=4533 RepID=J3N3E2_ORYBR
MASSASPQASGDLPLRRGDLQVDGAATSPLRRSDPPTPASPPPATSSATSQRSDLPPPARRPFPLQRGDLPPLPLTVRRPLPPTPGHSPVQAASLATPDACELVAPTTGHSPRRLRARSPGVATASSFPWGGDGDLFIPPDPAQKNGGEDLSDGDDTRQREERTRKGTSTSPPDEPGAASVDRQLERLRRRSQTRERCDALTPPLCVRRPGFARFHPVRPIWWYEYFLLVQSIPPSP